MNELETSPEYQRFARAMGQYRETARNCEDCGSQNDVRPYRGAMDDFAEIELCGRCRHSAEMLAAAMARTVTCPACLETKPSAQCRQTADSAASWQCIDCSPSVECAECGSSDTVRLHWSAETAFAEIELCVGCRDAASWAAWRGCAITGAH